MLSTYLKNGLMRCGNDVTLLDNGDGWKNIPGRDGILTKYSKNILIKVINLLIKPLYDKRLYSKYDAVFLINIDVFHPYIIHKALKKLSKNNKKIILLACGHDEALYRAYKNNTFQYYPFDGIEKDLDRFNNGKNSWTWYRKHHGELNDIPRYIDLVIPNCYEYKIGYDDINCNVYDCIPFPIDLETIKFTPNIVREKIVIFHGLNREIEKGTPYIREALDIIKEKYPDKVEVVIDGKMPYAKYVEVLNRSNIVIDQCKSYAYGMNACIAMAQGKVVLSGARDETLDYFKISRDECPIVPICPDVDNIVSQLEKLIEHPESISALGQKSRQYMEKYHDSYKVAQRYLKAIETIGD
jgi:glycosyltransferase involved in cell wall biosynthesis